MAYDSQEIVEIAYMITTESGHSSLVMRKKDGSLAAFPFQQLVSAEVTVITSDSAPEAPSPGVNVIWFDTSGG